MKKGITLSIVMSMLITGVITGVSTLFTGCGVETSVTGLKSVSGSATGNAVSGSAVTVKKEKDGQDRKRNCYQNDMYRYELEDNILYQCCLNEESRLNGKRIEIEEIIEADAELLWVTNQWLYYESNAQEKTLFRIPIEKTQQGESLRMEDKEKLFSSSDFHLGYVTDSYLIVAQGQYIDDWYKGDMICRYDLKDKKWTRIIGCKKAPEVLWGQYYPVMIHNRLIINAEGQLYSLDPDTGEMDVIYTYSGPYLLCVGSWEQYNGALYFLMDRTLFRYDGGSQRAESVISEADFLKKLDETDQDREDIMREDIMIEDMVLSGDKLYIDVMISKKEIDCTIIYDLITGGKERKVSKD